MHNDPSDHMIGPKMWAARVISWASAALGIGTFMGLVNTLIGVMSACWLALQIYGYIRYELPIKRYKRQRTLDALSDPCAAPDTTINGPLQ